MAKPTRTIEILYCYARKDSHLRDELEAHLEPILQSGIAISWHDRKIHAGQDWQRAIDNHLEQADLILLLISPSFMRSNYCYGVELQRALERHELGVASVIPIILRPVMWLQTPLGQLQALPRNGKPVVLWRSRDEAFTQIVQEIHTVILSTLAEDRHQKGYWMRLGLTHFHAKHYEQALLAYRQALVIAPSSSFLCSRIGETLALLGRPEEALAAFQASLDLSPNDVFALQGKAHMLLQLNRYEEALATYSLVLNHVPTSSAALCGMGHTLFALHQYEEALVTYERVITHHPENASSYHYKSIVLLYLTRYEEALTACQQALDRDPTESSFYLSMARILDQLGDKQESLHHVRLYDMPGSRGSVKRNYNQDYNGKHEIAHMRTFDTIHELVFMGGDDVVSIMDLGFPHPSSVRMPLSLEDKIIVPDADGNIFVYTASGELLWKYRPDR